MGSTDYENENTGEDAGAKVEAREAAPSRGPTFAAAEPVMEDLSAEIIQSIARGAGERVKCRRISGNHYRCNWWGPQSTAGYDNPAMSGLLVTTHRVIRSQMIHVTRSGKGLLVRADGRQ